MTRLRLAPRSLLGPLGPQQSPPPLQQIPSIPFQVHLVLFFFGYLFLYLTFFSSISFSSCLFSNPTVTEAHDVALSLFLIILHVPQLRKGLLIYS